MKALAALTVLALGLLLAGCEDGPTSCPEPERIKLRINGTTAGCQGDKHTTCEYTQATCKVACYPVDGWKAAAPIQWDGPAFGNAWVASGPCTLTVGVYVLPRRDAGTQNGDR